MSELDLGDALVIVHPLVAPALERNLTELLAPVIWQATTRSAPFTTAKLCLCGLSGAEWRQLLHDSGSDELPLQQLFSARGSPAVYFGLAPMPVALELGRRLGPTHRVLAYYSAPGPTAHAAPRPRR